MSRVSFVSAPLPSYTFQFPKPADPRLVVEVYFLAFTTQKSHCHFGEFLTKAKEVLKLKPQKPIQSIVEDCDNLRVTLT